MDAAIGCCDCAAITNVVTGRTRGPRPEVILLFVVHVIIYYLTAMVRFGEKCLEQGLQLQQAKTEHTSRRFDVNLRPDSATYFWSCSALLLGSACQMF